MTNQPFPTGLPWVTYDQALLPFLPITSPTAPAHLTLFEQILIILGTALLLGPQSLVRYALQPTKRRGAAAFTVGVALILLRWTLIGFAVEVYGAAILLSDALGVGAAWAGAVPIIGPYAATAMEWIRRQLGGAGRGSEPPV